MSRMKYFKLHDLIYNKLSGCKTRLWQLGEFCMLVELPEVVSITNGAGPSSLKSFGCSLISMTAGGI